jgi:hypothetical protein
MKELELLRDLTEKSFLLRHSVSGLEYTTNNYERLNKRRKTQQEYYEKSELLRKYRKAKEKINEKAN